MKKTLFIEPFSGISGDMLVGALLELVPDRRKIFDQIESLKTRPKFTLATEKNIKNGINATKFNVYIYNSDEKSRYQQGCQANEIFRIIDEAQSLSIQARNLAKRIFKRLADAEGKIHGVHTDHIHFHEIGAVDSIVDIVTASLLISELNLSEVVSSYPALGSGKIESEHGILPIPAPATAEILKGIPFENTQIKGELTTPTGAAILAEVVNKWGIPESGIIEATGYGAGSRTYQSQANVLRVTLLGDNTQEVATDKIVVIEANVDDMPAEFITYFSSTALARGALDFSVTPVIMKKNRPGHVLQIICKPEKFGQLSDFILRNTTTIGIRYRFENRRVLKREFLCIETSYGEVNAKLSGSRENGTFKIKPEIDDIIKIVEKRGLSFNQVYTDILNEIYTKIKIEGRF